MITKIGKSLNRIYAITIPVVDVDNSYVAIDVNIDPSQDLVLYGYGFGYNSISTEGSAFSQGNMFAVVNYQMSGAVNEFPLLYGVDNAFGEMILFDSLAMQNRNQIFKTMDFANPLVINSRNNFLMVVTKPFTTPAPTQPINVYAYLRGTYRQSENRFGDWSPR